jgi:hypothetical protein
VSVTVDASTRTFRYSNPRDLFSGPYVQEVFGAGDARSYDLSPDGRRFLMMKEPTPPPTKVVVVTNWIEEVNRLLGSK